MPLEPLETKDVATAKAAEEEAEEAEEAEVAVKLEPREPAKRRQCKLDRGLRRRSLRRGGNARGRKRMPPQRKS